MRYLSIFFLSIIAFASCKKYEDVPGAGDPRLTRKYCNDPEAVNYNWDFPGTPDNSVCFYPAEVFAGNYLFVDSVFLTDNTVGSADSLHLLFIPFSHTALGIKGYCGNGDTILLTANRYFRATVDSNTYLGQQFCDVKDTISGFVLRTAADTEHVQISFTIVTDTGTTTHNGIAIRQ